MLLILIDSTVAQANGIQLSHLQLAKIIDQLRAHDCALSITDKASLFVRYHSLVLNLQCQCSATFLFISHAS